MEEHGPGSRGQDVGTKTLIDERVLAMIAGAVFVAIAMALITLELQRWCVSDHSDSTATAIRAHIACLAGCSHKCTQRPARYGYAGRLPVGACGGAP